MRSFLIITSIIIVILIAACDSDDSTSPSQEPTCEIVILMDSAPVDTLHITDENDGDVYPILDGEYLLGEIDIIMETYTTMPPDQKEHTVFRMLARKDGCYTVYQTISLNSTFQIDYVTGFDAYDPGTTCGTVIMGSDSTGCFWGLIRDYTMAVWSEDDSIGTIYVDDDGRFETDLEAGDYTIKANFPEDIYSFEDTHLHLTEGYNDFFLPASSSADYKPNIYLYPTETTILDVSIDFPHGGMVTISDPHFPDQWQDIRVEPNGTIDSQYGYLFYESETPDFAQKTEGWVVAIDDLEDFFIGNLRETGFIQSEIDDFIEWWIPRLTGSEFYAIYPQYNAQIDPVIALEISQPPDNFIRLHYYVDAIESPDIELQTPVIPEFERSGFVVAEWGLIPSEDTKIQIAAE